MPVTHPEVENKALSDAVRVERRHHLLVRWAHWLNVPILLGLILSGMSIYWASPVYQHKPDPQTGNTDYVADAGVWITAHVPGFSDYKSPPEWVYNHFSLGTFLLAPALRLHWFFAYLFMLNGLVYLAGVGLGGGWRTLLPRRTDLRESLAMMRYYAGVPVAVVLRRKRKHPPHTAKYNALQRLAYFSVPVAGVLAIATGWAIHKPMQLHWLAAIFGGYDTARIWHFWLIWFFIVFAIPHIILVIADGWDTMRSMVTGWSTKTAGAEESENER